jgi:hypothetical protein
MKLKPPHRTPTYARPMFSFGKKRVNSWKRRVIAIELAHGVGVSWDGRVHRHCTAVPRHVALRDHLYALFLGQ